MRVMRRVLTWLCDSGPGIPTKEELFSQLSCRPGKLCTRGDVNSDLNALLSTGLFQKVSVSVSMQNSDRFHGSKDECNG